MGWQICKNKEQRLDTNFKLSQAINCILAIVGFVSRWDMMGFELGLTCVAFDLWGWKQLLQLSKPMLFDQRSHTYKPGHKSVSCGSPVEQLGP